MNDHGVFRKVVALIAAFLAATVAQGASLDDLHSELSAWVDHGDIVGAELFVARGDGILFHEAVGWANREAGVPLEKNAIYSIASLTKPVTALAILMLAEDGVLTLDHRVRDSLGNYGGDPRTTLGDLIANRSGDGGEHGGGGYNVYDFESLDGWVADWAGAESTAAYGEFAYSNFNFAAAALIAERLSGIPFEHFITRRIFEPLGMKDSHVTFTPDQPWAERALPAYTWNEESQRHEIFWTPDQPQRWKFFPGAFGLSSTVQDYARFMRFWLDGGVVDGRRLVSEAAIRSALSPQALRDGEPVYGFGWFVDPVLLPNGRPASFRHAGGRGTLAIGYPGDRGIVVYFTQTEPAAPPHMNVLANHIEMSGWFEHPGPDMVWARETANPSTALRGEAQAAYRGLYRGPVAWLNTGTWEHDVRIENGRLVLRSGRSGARARLLTHLVPLGGDRFLAGRYEGDELVGVDTGMTLRFVREQGTVTALETRFQGESESSFPRIPANR